MPYIFSKFDKCSIGLDCLNRNPLQILNLTSHTIAVKRQVLLLFSHCHFSCLVAKLCPTLCNPMAIVHQVPLSMGFSRQEYWSRLPFPSPGYISDPGIKLASPALAGRLFTLSHQGSPHFLMKRSESCSVVSDSFNPWTTWSTEFSRPEYWSGQPFPSPGDLPNPGIKPRSPALQVDSLPAEPQGQSKNTGMGILSLLRWIFPTQGSKRGLLLFSHKFP